MVNNLSSLKVFFTFSYFRVSGEIWYNKLQINLPQIVIFERNYV